MAYLVLLCFLLASTIFVYCCGWTAVRMTDVEAMMGVNPEIYEKQIMPDIRLPRNHLHSVYKFGYCPPEATVRQYLRSTVNISFDTYRDTLSTYLYVIADMKNTQRFKRQCVVMKFYIAGKFLFHTSRVPIYYCQGQLFVMMFNTVHRMALHEFYFSITIHLPVDIYFEFYHPYGYHIV